MNGKIVSWQGISGHIYQFEEHPLNANFTANIDGNYIFAKQTINGYNAIYIGEGDLKTRIADHLRDGSLTKKGTTHIHAHTNPSASSRKSEEEDLLAYSTEAYVPTGCNVNEGG